jgi:hypothetical protein
MCDHHVGPQDAEDAGNTSGTDTEESDMSTSTHRLTAFAGLCAAAAGAIFIGVQINHPPADVDHIVTTEMTVRETAKAVMSLLAIAGFAGMLARHRHRFGLVGRAGHVLVSIGFLAMFVIQCVVGYVLPTMADTDPVHVQDVLDAAMGNSPSGDIGNYPVLFTVAGIGFSLGGLLFGIALFRARILSRSASALFAYGTVSALALAALPDSFSRPFAVPTGLALIGLGVSLWRDQRHQVDIVDIPAGRVPELAAR